VDADAVLAGLDEDQRRAATSPAMPLAVVAPAGSGKTRVLAARLVHRIANGDVEPQHVLCVTFTRKAADELRARLRALGLHDRIEAGTFHGVAWRQLRDRWAAAGRTAPDLLDRIQPFLADHVATGASRAEVADLAGEIAWARARMVRPDGYEAAARAAGRRTRRPAGWVAERFEAYETAKARKHVVDFDDLLAACTSAMQGDAGFSAAQRWRFRHLFVDEFQDVNPLQFRLLEAWRGDRWDVFVVGDTHQSIYGWNGADPTLLETIGERWPALETIHLDRTHRSTPQITAAAAAVVRAAGLPDRHPVSSGAPGPAATLTGHPDEVAEITAVATAIRRRRGPDMPWSAFAVLARTHEQVLAAERGLGATGIPVQVRRQAATLGHPAVRRVLSRLRHDDRPLLSVLGDAVAGDGADEPELAHLLEVGETQVETDPSVTGRDFAGWVQARLTDDDARLDAVTIATIHASKGLEWPAVHIVGCEEGSIPHVSARRREARAEEARLLYVAVTRAVGEVHLHWARSRTIRGVRRDRARSPFLDGFEEATAEAPPADEADGHGHISELRAAIGGAPVPDPLLAALQAWRTGRARAARTAPEVVLGDETLRAIAASRPTTADAFASIPGIGAARARRFAPELIAIVERTAEPA
jgi:DNA helicase-2/ATP-dependent DNA helicase PcrA